MEHTAPEIDLSDINKKLENHEEEIQKLFELIDDLKKRNRDSMNNLGGPAMDNEELLRINNDIKKLYTLLEQL